MACWKLFIIIIIIIIIKSLSITVPRTQSTIGDRAFSVAAPRA